LVVYKKLARRLKTMPYLFFKNFYGQIQRRYSFLYAICKELLHRLRSHDTLERAYGLAFNFTLAIFPAIIFSFTLIPYIPIIGLEPKIVAFFKDVMPGSVYDALVPTIQDTVSKQRTGLLSFGFVSTLHLATNGMMSLMKTFHLADKDLVREQRSYLKQRAIATVLTLAFVCALFTTILLLVVARQALDYMFIHGFIASQMWVKLMLGLRWIILFFMFFITITGIYYLAPATKQHRPFVSIGAFVATTSSVLASLAFSYYVNNFANYNRLYGSLGIMIALMVWLFLISVTFLVGFELNISITKILQKQLTHNRPTSDS
jgi:membrane protein